MAKHIGKLVEVGKEGPGVKAVFYTHGSDSLRTYLGKAKLHSSPDRAALLGSNPQKTLIKDWYPSVRDWMRCKVCAPK